MEVRGGFSQDSAEKTGVLFCELPIELVEGPVAHAGRFADPRSKMIGLELLHQLETAALIAIGWGGAPRFQAGRLARYKTVAARGQINRLNLLLRFGTGEPPQPPADLCRRPSESDRLCRRR